MEFNGIEEAIEKINSLDYHRNDLLRALRLADETEEAIRTALERRGFIQSKHKIMFHVSRILNDYKVRERIRFEKAVNKA